MFSSRVMDHGLTFHMDPTEVHDMVIFITRNTMFYLMMALAIRETLDSGGNESPGKRIPFTAHSAYVYYTILDHSGSNRMGVLYLIVENNFLHLFRSRNDGPGLNFDSVISR